MSKTDDHGYPFFDEWLQAQAEPMPDFGRSVFGNTEPSPLTIDRLPERETETLFNSENKRQ